MDYMKELRQMLSDELENIVSRGNISRADLDTIFKIVDIIKDIDEISKNNASYQNLDGMDAMWSELDRMLNDDDMCIDDKSILKRAMNIVKR